MGGLTEMVLYLKHILREELTTQISKIKNRLSALNHLKCSHFIREYSMELSQKL